MSKAKAALGMFVKETGGRVRVHPQADEFGYSDGKKVESRILEILQEAADLSVGSTELMARIEDWPTEYHFTDTRVNLLRHLPLRPGMRVLELGAGCGAITRLLGESGCEVVAVEGSHLRARCASERVRDLENVSVYCANFQDVAFAREFDVVTLIGVLEYAPIFFEGEDPIGACLAVARSALAPGGTLVVAIENQLGLKYFAGATEDHLGTHFSGIENRYLANGVRTMGRQQLQSELRAAGFAEVSFQYPFPDYKLPVVIVFEPALAHGDFRPSEIVRHHYARDYARKDLRSIDASQVWPVLENNGLLGHLSNSFLVLARETSAGTAVGAPADGLLALAYSAGRAKRFQTRTAFTAGPDAAITCEKTLVYASAPDPDAATPGITHRLLRERYIRGATLHSAITAALRSGNRPLVISLIRRWTDFLADAAGTRNNRSWDDMLPGEFWDCMPGNLIDSEGQLHYFDAEWLAVPGPKLGHLVLRYLFGLGFGESSAPWFEPCFQQSSGPAIRSILDELGLPLTEAALADFAREANEKNAVIFPLKPPLVLEAQHYFGPVDAPSGRSAAAMVMKVLRGISRAFDR